MRNAFTLLTFFILHSSFFVQEAMAQTPPPGGSPSLGAPIDGLSAVLMAAGVGYGIRMIGNKRREKE